MITAATELAERLTPAEPEPEPADIAEAEVQVEAEGELADDPVTEPEASVVPRDDLPDGPIRPRRPVATEMPRHRART